MKKYELLVIMLALSIISACSQQKNEITISAAASLQKPLMEIKDYYEKNHNESLNFNFGSSGALQKQIEQGAPVDLYISASFEHVEQLTKKKLVKKQDTLLKNRLVLIAHKDRSSIKTIKDLTKTNIETIALGIPETVPAGDYGKEALENMGLWEKLHLKMVFAKDVKQVLSYVETKSADAGIVYATDAKNSSNVRVIYVFQESSHSPITYHVALIQQHKIKHESEEFYSFLKSKKAKQIFKKYGFTVE
jgi:molybdate transport system substrate-binding protein